MIAGVARAFVLKSESGGVVDIVLVLSFASRPSSRVHLHNLGLGLGLGRPLNSTSHLIQKRPYVFHTWVSKPKDVHVGEESRVKQCCSVVVARAGLHHSCRSYCTSSSGTSLSFVVILAVPSTACKKLYFGCDWRITGGTINIDSDTNQYP